MSPAYLTWQVLPQEHYLFSALTIATVLPPFSFLQQIALPSPPTLLSAPVFRSGLSEVSWLWFLDGKCHAASTTAFCEKKTARGLFESTLHLRQKNVESQKTCQAHMQETLQNGANQR